MFWLVSTPRRRAVALTAVTAAVTTLTLVGAFAGLTAAADTGTAGDPRRDWATVVEWPDAGIAKRCDGTTLLYLHAAEDSPARSLAVVPDSPECGR